MTGYTECWKYWKSDKVKVKEMRCHLLLSSNSEPNLRWRSRRRCSTKESVLKNSINFTGRHLCQSLFLNKVVGLRIATLLKTKSGTGLWPCEFCKVFKNFFFTEHLWTTASSEILSLDGCLVFIKEKNSEQIISKLLK